MLNGSITPAFVAYCVTALLLSLNLIFLWSYSGAARARSRVAINPEDAATRGIPVEPVDPAPVARVLRAHANAQAAILPFLVLGLLYVLTGGGFWPATIIFAVFVAARWTHSAVYLAGKQPWRTLAFVVGAIATLALMVALIWRLFAAR